MNWNRHSELEGSHAFLSASKYYWINYDAEKLIESYNSFTAVQKGTELHDFASRCIRLGQKLYGGKTTLSMFVNDAMPEQNSKGLNWSYGISGYRLAHALLNWQVEQLSDEYFRMVNTDSDDLKVILKAFGLNLPARLFTRGDLRSLKSSCSVF